MPPEQQYLKEKLVEIGDLTYQFDTGADALANIIKMHEAVVALQNGIIAAGNAGMIGNTPPTVKYVLKINGTVVSEHDTLAQMQTAISVYVDALEGFAGSLSIEFYKEATLPNGTKYIVTE